MAALAVGVLRGPMAWAIPEPLVLLFWKRPDRSWFPWKAAHYGCVSCTH